MYVSTYIHYNRLHQPREPTDLGVGHPAAGLHLVGVQAPELELLFKQRAAHVGRVVEFASPIVVEHLGRSSVSQRANVGGKATRLTVVRRVYRVSAIQ